uniref:Carbonyl reductase 1 n=1 Tax=Sinocyclocheilus grahami TaxID=75366 RepID=A0A672P1W0_SINGR
MKRVAVVTGANKGIGLAIKLGQEAVAGLQSEGCKNLIFYELDICDQGSSLKLKKFLEKYNGLDVLINNAGISQCFCTHSSRLFVSKRAYCREFLLDVGRNTFLELNSAHAEELRDLGVLWRPTPSPTPTAASRPQRFLCFCVHGNMAQQQRSGLRYSSRSADMLLSGQSSRRGR